MCDERNNSIYSECRDAIFKERHTRRMTNREMRKIIAEKGGCVQPDRQRPDVHARVVSN
jgi:hypothetical protein